MSILTITITIIVVVLVIGFFKGLRPQDRGAIIRSGIKLTSQSVAYSVVASKKTVQLAYLTGNNAGLHTEVAMAEQLKTVRDWESANNKPVQDGVTAANKHLSEMGILDAIAEAKTTNTDLNAKLAAL